MVAEALERGSRVAATTRTQGAHADLVARFGEQFLPLTVDVRDDGEVSSAVGKATDLFGQLDVVVYNAGYAQIGAVEELTEREWREQFEVSFFGAVRLLRNVLPHMRERGAFQFS